MKIEVVIIVILAIFAIIFIAYRRQNIPQVNNEYVIKKSAKTGKLTKTDDKNFYGYDVIAFNPSGDVVYVKNNTVYTNFAYKTASFYPGGKGKRAFVITSVAASTDKIFIADAGNAEILIYDYHGKLINKIGKPNNNTGFIIPSPYFDVVWDDAGKKLYVTNPGNHRIEIYDNTGKYISAWGKFGGKDAGFTGCCNPADIAIYNNTIAVAEKGTKRVRLFSKDGHYISTIADADDFPLRDTTVDLFTTRQNKLLLKDRKSKQIYLYTE